MPTKARFERVLVANRGEIAVRIIRACHQLGLETVAIYSSADKGALHTLLASRSLCIGPATAKDSYLNINAILEAAKLAAADAIHPGYGFLAERAEFARAVTEAGLVFLGPDADTIATMGDKVRAIEAMKDVGIPTLPGSDGALDDDMAKIGALASDIGYPVLIKASAGGGGRGMRRVDSAEELAAAIALTRSEALSAFGDDTLYLEKFLTHPRHIEFQMLADGEAALCLGERDCSAQRRHQKLIEEAPALGIAREQIREMANICEAACRRLGYRGVGTFEFLYQDGAFFFIEMNTRIQVEHTVTEMVTGLDLVAWQLKVALGQALPPKPQIQGHAIECRINAEDPHSQLPSPGLVTQLKVPGGPGVRWDSYLFPGARVPAFYDSLVGKLICHGATREEAIARLRQALTELEIQGIAINSSLHLQLIACEAFQPWQRDIHFVDALSAPGIGQTNL
ncbi:acetyl-CoA carboxylase biotin carboxylase subunit [Shewanella litorisediminis]|uniref:biotin carboxylase n=1 Tax=Shewanella litorisediminis TaxID=1173586 RepID=A0ABX7G2C1_9GAMM|nr:acetyl-CoA carboxylase biotin carboxylase subunit [Shewanella litorisediminis]MCL2918576.1 acetyl-CoA carboxylase biotin carboxylase subunit [Shewanella litorisediminis]QRH01400.1 acetyl-CoA carboxylase biotin carboxylase subunit [Shewanella litorisediminis]